jgi:hypothetical protein
MSEGKDGPDLSIDSKESFSCDILNIIALRIDGSFQRKNEGRSLIVNIGLCLWWSDVGLPSGAEVSSAGWILDAEI